MDYIKFLIGFLSFFVGFKLIKKELTITKTIVNTSTFLMISLFTRSLLKDINLVQQVITFGEIVFIPCLAGIFFKKNNKKYQLSNSDNQLKTVFSYYLLVLIVVIQALHYFYDFVIIGIETKKKSFELANQFGFIFSIIFLFCCNSNINLKSVLFKKQFVLTIVITSIVTFLLIMLISLGYINGNTAKTLDSTGGIGLQNISTNETGLLALCTVVYCMYYLKNADSYKLYFRVSILLSFVVILLTQSRISMICVSVIGVSSIYNLVKKRYLTLIPLLFLLGVIASSLLERILSIFKSRNQNDTVDIEKIAYSNVASQLGFTLSGRILIWEAYVSEFFKYDVYTFLFGTGFLELVEIYKKSYLPVIGGYSTALNIDFFPLHSDFLMLLISGGAISILIWILLIFKIFQKVLLYKNFISSSCLLILFAYSLFDMFNYSMYSSLLIGIGISQYKSKNER